MLKLAPMGEGRGPYALVESEEMQVFVRDFLDLCV